MLISSSPWESTDTKQRVQTSLALGNTMLPLAPFFMVKQEL